VREVIVRNHAQVLAAAESEHRRQSSHAERCRFGPCLRMGPLPVRLMVLPAGTAWGCGWALRRHPGRRQRRAAGLGPEPAAPWRLGRTVAAAAEGLSRSNEGDLERG
jgi:hypothetical protein